MKRIILFVNLLLCLNLLAKPESVEVIFLSAPKVGYLETVIHKTTSLLFSKKYVQNSECVPMGEGCFHPQLGFVGSSEKLETLKVEDDPSAQKIEEEPTVPVKLETINALETSLIKCDKSNYFDLYCGAASKNVERKPSDNALWIDISTSMRQVDAQDKAGYCGVRKFVEKMQTYCQTDLEVFNTSKKEIMSPSVICDYQGTNETSRFVEWIKNSSVKNLVIITDIDEYKGDLSIYLEEIGATITGVGVKPFTVTDLDTRLHTLFKSCKK